MPDSFDEAFPGGFEECVATLGNEPSIDDAEALCGWLQEHGFDAIAEASPDSILAGLEVEFVSVVDEPAQDSEWLLAKSATAETPWTPGGDDRIREAGVLLKQDGPDAEDATDDDPERKVWAAVLKPGEADAHGDLVPEPEIEQAAHEWMKNHRKVDSDHDLLDGEGVPVESYIVRGGPEEFETPDGATVEYPEGTWILGVELSEEAWTRVQNGDLTGFSIYGGAARLNPDALLTEAQAEAVARARSRTRTAKQVPEALLDAFRGYFEDHDGTPSEVSLSEFLRWALDDGEEVEVGGATVEAAPRGDDDAGAQAQKQSLLQSIAMDETELQNLLGEIRDQTESIAKSVEDLDDRVTALENGDAPDDEGVSKSDADGGADEEIVRKGDKRPTSGEEVEKTRGEAGVSLSWDGITDAGRVD